MLYLCRYNYYTQFSIDVLYFSEVTDLNLSNSCSTYSLGMLLEQNGTVETIQRHALQCNTKLFIFTHFNVQSFVGWLQYRIVHIHVYVPQFKIVHGHGVKLKIIVFEDSHFNAI